MDEEIVLLKKEVENLNKRVKRLEKKEKFRQIRNIINIIVFILIVILIGVYAFNFYGTMKEIMSQI